MLGKIFGYIKNLDSSLHIGLSTKEEREHRLAICRVCPNYGKDFRYLLFFKKKNIPQCGVCKCALNDKVLFNNEKCPIDKWT